MMSYVYRNALVAVLAVLLTASAGFAGSITLKRDAVLAADAEVVVLSDIALVAARNAAFTEELSEIPLLVDIDGASANGSVDVSRDDVIAAIEAAGVRVSRVAVSGDHLRVRLHPRDSRRVRSDAPTGRGREIPVWETVEEARGTHPLTDAVLATVLADHALEAGEVRVRLDRPSAVKVRELSRSQRFVIERVSTPNSSRGVFRVTAFDESDTPGRPFNIAMDIEVLVDAMVLTGEVGRGDAITGADYVVEQRWRGPAAVDLLTLEETASLPLAKTRLAEGVVLTTVNTEPPIVVKRRQAVRVYAHADGIAIRIDAIAMEDGAIGDVVRCTPMGARGSRGDQRVLFARVTAPGELSFESASTK